MSHPQNSVNRVSPGLFVTIFLCLLSLYLATYSGRVESTDSLLVVDAASSLVNFGDTALDETLWQSAPRIFELNEQKPYNFFNLRQPVMAYLAAVPYALAKAIPQVGQLHAVWLLNIILTALSGSLMYALAVTSGYRQRTAIIGALLYGCGTLVWAYSKTLFRDPVITLLLLAILLFLQLWRNNRRNVLWLLIVIVLLIAGGYTKFSMLVVLPALMIWILPDRSLPLNLRRIIDVAFIVCFITLTGLAFSQPFIDFIKYIAAPLINIDATTARIAIHSYLFSMGGSVWATSPVLVLSVAGVILLIRNHQRRIAWTVLLIIAGYAAGHAFLTQVHWFGGLSLPPRFMLPVVPVLFLTVLPVIESAFDNRHRIIQALIATIVIFSVSVQVIFAVSLVDAYVELIPPESGGLVEWVPGLNQPQYLRWLLLPQSWSSLGWDIAWTRINAGWVGIGFLILAGVALLAIIIKTHRNKLASIAATGIIMLGAIGLSQLYSTDTLYWAQTPELFNILTILEREASDGEPVFMAGSADVTYERFIMNYNTTDNFRPVVIGFQPGERTSPDDTPSITSDYNRERLDVTMLRYIDQVAQTNDRFWWIAHNGPFTEWALRPEEQYFKQNYYLVNEYETGNPTVRLLEFRSFKAPDRSDFRLPDNQSMFRFDDNIRLTGYSLPAGITVSQGDVFPVTLYWQTDAPLNVNYTIASFLVNPGVIVIEGIDSLPDGGFAPAAAWQPGQIIAENRAITVPPDAPPGNYQVWIRIYVTETGGREQLAVTGGETFEDTTAILPVTIDVIPD